MGFHRRDSLFIEFAGWCKNTRGYNVNINAPKFKARGCNYDIYVGGHVNVVVVRKFGGVCRIDFLGKD